jgi:uncharacterized protein YbaR (Trm112 family)
MRRDLMDILACPVDKGTLTLTVTSEDASEVLAGTLHCESCGEDYPIADGIPNLLPPDLRRAIEAEQASGASGAAS